MTYIFSVLLCYNCFYTRVPVLFERPRLINIIEHLLIFFKDDRTLRKNTFYIFVSVRTKRFGDLGCGLEKALKWVIFASKMKLKDEKDRHDIKVSTGADSRRWCFSGLTWGPACLLMCPCIGILWNQDLKNSKKLMCPGWDTCEVWLSLSLMTHLSWGG